MASWVPALAWGLPDHLEGPESGAGFQLFKSICVSEGVMTVGRMRSESGSSQARPLSQLSPGVATPPGPADELMMERNEGVVVDQGEFREFDC